MERNRWLQILIILLVIIAGLYLGGMVWQLGARFSDIILPFFLAWLLAYTLNPLANMLQRYERLPRIAAIAVVYLALILGLILVGVLIVPPLVTQAVQVGRLIPDWVQQWPQALDGVQRFLNERGFDVKLSTSLVTDAALVQRAELIGTALASNALVLAQGIASFLLTSVIVIILSAYFMVDGDRFSKLFLQVLPIAWKDEALYLLESIDRTFGGFMRGLLIQSLVYSIGTGIIMALAGLPFIVLVSVFAGVVVAIPFFGSIVAIIPPLLLVLLTGDWLRVVLVLIGLMLLQQLVLNVITPKVMSDSVGIHPLLIFAAVLLGTKEAGIWGAIFGVPIAGVIWSMIVQIYRQRTQRELIVPKPREERPMGTVIPVRGFREHS